MTLFFSGQFLTDSQMSSNIKDPDVDRVVFFFVFFFVLFFFFILLFFFYSIFSPMFSLLMNTLIRKVWRESFSSCDNITEDPTDELFGADADF